MDRRLRSGGDCGENPRFREIVGFNGEGSIGEKDGRVREEDIVERKRIVEKNARIRLMKEMLHAFS
jgi:hypothetical protein